MMQLLAFALARCLAALRVAVLLLAFGAGTAAAGAPINAQSDDPKPCDLPGPDLAGNPDRVAPPMIGLPVERAEALLRRLEVEWRIFHVDSSRPAGQVEDQWPEAGDPIFGQVALLCVSNGEPVTNPPVDPEPAAVPLMPEVRGSSLDQARQLLAARQIDNIPDVRRSAHSEPAGTIYAQSPPPGAEVAAGDPIVLSLSDGPAAAPVQPPAAEAPPAVESGSVEAKAGPVRTENRLLRLAIPAIVAAIALAVVALMTKAAIPRRPRLRVTMAGPPMTTVAWGEPPDLSYEVRLIPPRGRCRPDPDEGGAADG